MRMNWQSLKQNLAANLGALLAVSLVCAAALLIIGSRSRKSGEPPSTAAGQQRASACNAVVDADATLFIQGTANILIAVDQTTLDQLVRALSNRDSEEVEKLEQSGKLLTVENRTRIQVLERDNQNVKIRIAEGKYQWAEGWVPDPWVR